MGNLDQLTLSHSLQGLADPLSTAFFGASATKILLTKNKKPVAFSLWVLFFYLVC